MTADAIVIPDIDYTRCEKPKKTHDEWIKSMVKPGDPKNGDKLHKFTPCRYGAPQVGELCKPSYSGIETVNMALEYDLSGNIQEMWAIINPVNQVIRQWTYRGMQIREEVLS